MITHHSTCRSDYPEKPDGESAQQVQRIPLGNGEVVRQCVDCGAHEVINEGEE